MNAKIQTLSKKMNALVILIFILSNISACQKAPGEGGTGDLLGQVIEIDEDTPEGYGAPDQKVFLIYGDNAVPDDDTRTGPDGVYQFTSLYKGKYTVFAYSECEPSPDTCLSGQEPILETVYLDKRGQTNEVPIIFIKNL